MAKFTDAVEATLSGYFDINDQPTEVQFDAFMAAIQAGIDEHDHTEQVAGDGLKTLGSAAGPITLTAADVFMLDGGTFGITGNELLTVNAAGNFIFSGAQVGIGCAPFLTLCVEGVAVSHIANFYSPSDDWGSTFGRRSDATTGCAMNLAANDATGYGILQAWNYDAAGGGAIPLRIQPDGGAVRIADLAGANQAVGADATGTLYVPHASDRKLKKNIKPLVGGLDTVLALRPVTFDWKKTALDEVGLDFTGCGKQVGLIAQEVVEAIPLARSDGRKYESYDRNMIMPYVIEAIRELDTRLTQGGL